MLKRVYHPINKAKIQEAIDYYKEFSGYQKLDDSYEKYYNAWHEVCPGSNAWASLIFQPMLWSGTLDVEHVYYAILAMGINTTLEEVDD